MQQCGHWPFCLDLYLQAEYFCYGLPLALHFSYYRYPKLIELCCGETSSCLILASGSYNFLWLLLFYAIVPAFLPISIIIVSFSPSLMNFNFYLFLYVTVQYRYIDSSLLLWPLTSFPLLRPISSAFLVWLAVFSASILNLDTSNLVLGAANIIHQTSRWIFSTWEMITNFYWILSVRSASGKGTLRVEFCSKQIFLTLNI
jgi:hypothetical protein